ncbi:unnamed protein product [Fraxinus pennsylvanica]|uniref:Uncharacterized protein n=1 Tax=Fraxinus pennsylvanica TaxID=56036 RepID=A0AAD2DMG2_9LAMI|nr:unnamed protein product [Fraxinus pennsylvanica]
MDDGGGVAMGEWVSGVSSFESDYELKILGGANPIDIRQRKQWVYSMGLLLGLNPLIIWAISPVCAVVESGGGARNSFHRIGTRGGSSERDTSRRSGAHCSKRRSNIKSHNILILPEICYIVLHKYNLGFPPFDPNFLKLLRHEGSSGLDHSALRHSIGYLSSERLRAKEASATAPHLRQGAV